MQSLLSRFFLGNPPLKSPPPSGTMPLHFLTLKTFLYTLPLYSQLFVLKHHKSFSKKVIGIFTQRYEIPKCITSHTAISKNIIQKCESSNTGIFTSYLCFYFSSFPSNFFSKYSYNQGIEKYYSKKSQRYWIKH